MNRGRKLANGGERDSGLTEERKRHVDCQVLASYRPVCGKVSRAQGCENRHEAEEKSQSRANPAAIQSMMRRPGVFVGSCKPGSS